jgi:predicted TPR repeat methyltransferase
MSEPDPSEQLTPALLQTAAAHYRAGRLREAEEIYRRILLAEPDRAEALHGVGLLALQVGKAELAAAYLGRAAQAAPQTGVYRYNQGEAWLLVGDHNQAAACLQQAVALDPARPEPHAALGVAWSRLQRFADAASSLQKAIDLGMDRPELDQHLGNALLQLNRFAEAERFARKAIERVPNSAESSQTLGEALAGLGRHDEAMESFRRAVAIKPDFALPHYSLGMTLGQLERFEEAIDELRAALRLRKDYFEALSAMGTMLIGKRQLEEAVQTLREALRLRPDHLDTHIELARALEVARRFPEAAEQFREILKLTPDNPNLKFHIAALSGKEAPPAVPASLVTTLFERHADSFDEHLLEQLEYRVPRRLHEAVVAAGAGTNLDVLDLGCGTGLCGVLLRPMARKLIGVDLSPAMLAKARERNLYDGLEVADVTATLRAAPSKYDLLVAGDVLCYLGDLSGVFDAASKSLRPGGLFAFSVETHPGPGWLLRPTRRYAHATDYIRQAANAVGFDLVSSAETALRKEGGNEVLGLIVVLRAPAGNKV